MALSALGNRFAVPYLLSFVGSEYWSMRVWYSLGCKDSLAPEGQKDVTILTAPYASLNYITGDFNILSLLIDTEHKQARARNFDSGRSGVQVPIIGHALCNFDNLGLPGVRDLVDAFLGPAGEDVAPGGGQLDVSLAWEYMYNYIATPGCAEHALALASQMSRRFPVDPLVKAETNGDSIGLFSTLAHLFEQANGRSFPKVKVWPAGEQWTAAAPVHLTWLGWYNIGQSGMLPEAAFAAPEGAAYPPGFDENQLGVSPSLAVCSASPTFRMARALDLIEGEPSSTFPAESCPCPSGFRARPS